MTRNEVKKIKLQAKNQNPNSKQDRIRINGTELEQVTCIQMTEAEDRIEIKVKESVNESTETVEYTIYSDAKK